MAPTSFSSDVPKTKSTVMKNQVLPPAATVGAAAPSARAWVSSAHITLVGWHHLLVNSSAAAAVISTVLPFSAATRWAATATGVAGRSTMASTPESYHCRAIAPATSGFNWQSAWITSIGRPSTLGPKSAAAMWAARIAPVPEESAA